MYTEKELSWYDRHGKQRPEHATHGEDTWEHPASEKLERLQCTNWRLEGNKLTCDTNNGTLTQLIPTNVILEKIEDGMPKFKRI
jgi:hypothetical protein